MLFLLPSYYNFTCINQICSIDATDCVCGFLYLEFFVTFIWAYVIANLLGETAMFLRKKVKK